MVDLLHDSIRKARKPYLCGGHRIITANYDTLDCNEIDCSGWIHKGETYHHRAIADGGTVHTYRTCRECDAYLSSNDGYDE